MKRNARATVSPRLRRVVSPVVTLVLGSPLTSYDQERRRVHSMLS
ncbi:MAG: hypothetical protein PVJ43_07355 [Gemmatimonadales bacterium]|jgi:hypothetical protein